MLLVEDANIGNSPRPLSIEERLLLGRRPQLDDLFGLTGIPRLLDHDDATYALDALVRERNGARTEAERARIVFRIVDDAANWIDAVVLALPKEEVSALDSDPLYQRALLEEALADGIARAEARWPLLPSSVARSGALDDLVRAAEKLRGALRTGKRAYGVLPALRTALKKLGVDMAASSLKTAIPALS